MAVSANPRFRITLWSIAANGWRDAQKAVIYDAKNIGIEDRANDAGSAFWTLDNDHPQIAECVPLARHYEIARWSQARNRWEFVGAGMLNDYSVTEYQTVFNGIDYKAVLNQINTPLTQVTTDYAATLNTDIGPNGVIDASDDPFAMNLSTDSTKTRYYNDSGDQLFDWAEPPATVAYAADIRKVTVTEYNAWTAGTSTLPVIKNIDTGVSTTYWQTPAILLYWTAQWISPTIAGFQVPPPMYFRVYASPPAYRDAGAPPLDNIGLLGQFYDSSMISPSGALTEGSTFGTYYYFFVPQELKLAISAAGYTFTGYDSIPATYTDPTVTYTKPIAALKNGVTYTFQIYAAIKRTSTNAWFRSHVGAISMPQSAPTTNVLSSEVTMGQAEAETLEESITRVFNAAKNINSYSRIRYASLSTEGSLASADVHNSFSAGEPVLQYISSLCDVEMGTRTDGSKVVFAIDKPTGGNSYGGNFKIRINVSSATSSTFALRYPETIKAFSYSPGYSRVRNDITLIPLNGYLSGNSGQLSSGSSIIGATAVDTASQSANGYIPLIATKGGLVDSSAAQNEANRLLLTYKIANTKQVNLRTTLDTVDLWNGWDIGDTVRVTIKRGLINLDEGFVITGVRWYGELDGHERIELDLIQGTAFAAAYANQAPAPATPSTPIVTPPNTTGG